MQNFLRTLSIKSECYRNRLSGPLLDCIDLHIKVPRVPHKDLPDQSPAEDNGVQLLIPTLFGQTFRDYLVQFVRFSRSTDFWLAGVTNATPAGFAQNGFVLLGCGALVSANSL